jgi:hypothetical protein
VSKGTPAPGGARPRWAPGTVDPTPGAGRQATSPARRGSSPFRRAGTSPRSGATPSAVDSPHSASSAGSSDSKSGRRPKMVVAHEAEGGCSPGAAQPGPRGWRNEDGPRSRRKNRVIERTPGSPGRSSPLPLVRPGSVLCAGISRIFHSHVLTAQCPSTGASMSGLASGEGAGASASDSAAAMSSPSSVTAAGKTGSVSIGR